MVRKKTWILIGIYFILGSFIGYFTSIRAEFSYNVYRIFDYAVPSIILMLFCAILAKTQKEIWKNGIASGVGLALGHDIYFGVSSYLELGRNKEYLCSRIGTSCSYNGRSYGYCMVYLYDKDHIYE